MGSVPGQGSSRHRHHYISAICRKPCLTRSWTTLSTTSVFSIRWYNTPHPWPIVTAICWCCVCSANKPFSPSRDNKGQDIKGQSSSPPVLVLIPTEHRTSQILLVPSGGFCSRDTAPFCRFISACVCPDGIFPVPLYIPLFVFVDHIALPTLPILSSAPRFIWLF
ncbi:hypothetical protein M440DRAFT_245179 [Trichoderma longibrachiatum ATCC 18648]|uniref:Uncharacterized protein n=1 Tax=Trichoderma longibrachiatum ATCC 18648 TaxID=983965 RepID=A0A2T4CDS9_TRILO|nr:hypothetical protein M440DRAFT_245179 [Trichoderma longibrachiatum ATCC 18648]